MKKYLPIVLLLLFICSIVSARTLNRRAACMNNLKQIALAIQIYAEYNEGNFPPNLEVLHPDYTDDDIKLFHCSGDSEEGIPRG